MLIFLKKWFLPINNANIFQTNIIRNLADLRGIQQAEKELDKNVLEITKLVQKIGDLSKIKFKQKTFFLYNESSYINHTFYTEPKKKLQIYGLISSSAISIKATNLLRPKNSLKFRVLNNKYMDHIVLQLEDKRKPGKTETKDAKLTHFSILSTKPKRKIGFKRKMSYQLVDEFRIVGLQNYNLDEKLSPIEINICGSEIQGKLSRYGTQCYKYCFIVDSLLISSSVAQDINVIFLICNGLKDARDSLINGKPYKSISVININKIKDWAKLKGEFKWINIIFNNSENPKLAKKFAFAYETVNLSDLLNFQLSLLDDEAKPIKFAPNEKKNTSINI